MSLLSAYVFALWTLVYFVSSTKLQNDYDIELQAFTSAFGHDLIDTHFASSTNVYKNALSRKTSSYNADASKSSFQNSDVYVACCEYESATKVSSNLRYLYGDNNVQTVYLSAPLRSATGATGDACFLVSSSRGSRPVGLTVWSPFLDEMKIEPALVDTILSWGSAEDITSRDLSMYEMEVVFGLGSGKGMRGNSGNILTVLKAEAKQTKALSNTNRIFANMDLSGKTKASQLWVRSKAAIGSAMSSLECNFEMLSYDVRPYSVIIGNLGAWMKTNVSSGCLPLLVATYAQNFNTQHISMQQKNRVVNEVVNKYLQVGDSATAPRYSGVGLKGTGVVVGVADTGVDELSCYFSNTDGSSVLHQAANYVDNSKRKVIQYYSFADSNPILQLRGL